MRSIWKGQVNFGMVSIPTKLYSQSDKRGVSFHQYHSCGSRIQMPKWCPVCDRKVEASEIEKGYEVSKDQHIILTEQDFDSLPLKTLKTIEVIQFAEDGIDQRCFADCYFLSCEDTGAKAFKLLLDGMRTLGVVGIAKLCYREREHLSVIRPYENIMLLQTLHYADELRAYSEIEPRQVVLSDKETELAQSLVKAMMGDFSLADYHNEYKEALETLIEAKLNGEVIATSEAKQSTTTDVADALIKSLEMAGVSK